MTPSVSSVIVRFENMAKLQSIQSNKMITDFISKWLDLIIIFIEIVPKIKHLMVTLSHGTYIV